MTKLIVEDCHHHIKHNGKKHTLSEVRKEYWIPRGKSYIKQIPYYCIICKRPNLPLSSVDDSYPFICTGIDYTGVVYCRSINNDDVLKERDHFKYCIVIYTCASTRGVMLDVVPDGSAETFINSLKKFISRRGCQQQKYYQTMGMYL